MAAKKWWQSKMIWLGIIEVAGGVVEFIFSLPVGASATTIVMGIITIIFRAITKQPIEG